ncbi:FAD-dependent monooxygenase [Hoeflea sp. G2-23]|uniref:FAD-dependent monooxygenase n=1 Tax=Hoeflea algicola TaxID=2983763 RepID=A0ABT3Z6L1_9HYPH|nr:FAD-dependent monooxygenase [Hoeflea algicola]MCY0147019.1 FAD-dependent monooxygenase [Hoeflea algicola]
MAAQNIQIIGAGIAGLTAALAFARNGHDVEIVDSAHELSEVGAGLQVSPNASRILNALDLGAALDAAMTRPAQITLASGRSLRTITGVPCGEFATRRWGAPYGVLHRADLQRLLLDAVKAEPRCCLRLDQRIETADIARMQRQGRLIVGADGVWSQTRRLVTGAARPEFSGQVAWRFIVPVEAVTGVIDPRNVTAFLGARTHLVAYPLDHGKSINMVAITKGKDPGQTWAEREIPADRATLLATFSDWHPALGSILRGAPDMTWWPLFEMADGHWGNGTDLLLIGDAAHAMTPFAAQGAAMAIEDGYELAQAVTCASSGLGPALASFENRRRTRIAKARSRAAFNQFAYHARGPVRLGRDLVLALKSPESLAGDLDWLYGYRATGL